MSEKARLGVEQALKNMWAETMRRRREQGLCETCGEEPITTKQEYKGEVIAYYGDRCWREVRQELINGGLPAEKVDASVTFNFKSLEEV